uniref:ATP synthase F0 subunit 8 n=1 Tax=Aeneolamia contigua TaxID=295213 RepID=A0A096VHU5_9HEMI|nr:ATP synthase F0 subunit 8 [Aeneolamia contigua]AFV32118.1 ATP synthase F0 subunit 8 [Aeneolamia contigua]
MPQMAPMSWMMLMSMFIVSYMMFNMVIYFTQELKTNKKKNKIMILQMNWKW